MARDLEIRWREKSNAASQNIHDTPGVAQLDADETTWKRPNVLEPGSTPPSGLHGRRVIYRRIEEKRDYTRRMGHVGCDFEHQHWRTNYDYRG